MAKGPITVESEIRRLKRVFKDMPKNSKAVTEGLIVEAARLRVRLDQLWADIQEKGETELFTQSEKTPGYERERPQARLYNSTDKNYQACIKKLLDAVPAESRKSALDEFLK